MMGVEMRPCFVVTPDVEGELPRLAVVERLVEVVDGGTYVCRMLDLPWCPCPWRTVTLRLEGLEATSDLRGKIRAHAARCYVARHLERAENIALRDIRRDTGGRVLADVHADFHSLTEFLVEAMECRG